MAIFETGGVVGAISGDLGGACFSNPQGSKVARKKRRPSPHRLPVEFTSNTKMTYWVKKWAGLTNLQKTAWRTSARLRPRSNRLGISAQNSGFNLFVLQNTIRHSDSSDPITIPPSGIQTQFLSNWILTSTIAGGIIIGFDDVEEFGDRQWISYGGNPMRSTVPKFNRDWVFLENSGTTGFTKSLSDSWEKHWPLPELGQVIACRILFNNTFEMYPSNPIDLFAITTA